MLPKVAEALMKHLRAVNVKDEADTDAPAAGDPIESAPRQETGSFQRDERQSSGSAPEKEPMVDVDLGQKSTMSLSQKFLHILDSFRSDAQGGENGKLAYKKSQKAQKGTRTKKGTIMDRKAG